MNCPHCGQPPMKEGLTVLREVLIDAVNVMDTYQRRFIDPDDHQVLKQAKRVLAETGDNPLPPASNVDDTDALEKAKNTVAEAEEDTMQAVLRYNIEGDNIERIQDENGKWVPWTEHERMMDYLEREPKRLRTMLAYERNRLAKRFAAALALDLHPLVRESLMKYQYEVEEGKK